MKNKLILLLCALGGCLILIPVSIGTYNDYKLYTEGKLVKVSITSVPHNTGSRSKGTLWFNFNGKECRMTVTGQVDDYYQIGDTIQLKYLNDGEDNFMFPSLNQLVGGLLCILVIPAAVGGCIYSLIRNKPI